MVLPGAELVSDALVHVLRSVLDEVPGRYGKGYTVEQAKTHLLDRWYYFTEFGVRGRDDLKKATVKLMVVTKKKVTSSELTVDLGGTALEGK